MENGNSKKYILRISLIFILLISAFLCIYTVRNYNVTIMSNSNMEPNQNGNIQSGKNGGITLPNRNIQSGENRGMTRQNGNAQPGQNRDNQSSDKGNIQQGDNGNKQQRQNENMRRGNINTKYFPVLTIYSIIFAILCIGGYYLFRCKNIKINFADEKIVICIILAIGFLLRIAASTLMEGYGNDINLFKTWAVSAANGLSQVYLGSRPADYPPIYIYVLALIGKIANIPALNSYYVLLLKLPAIIADIITAYFIYRLGKKHFTPIISVFLGTFYIFNPAIFIDSTFWGQVDSFFTLFIIVAVFLLSENKIIFSSAIFAIAVLMKPQGIIFLPILFFELLHERKVKNFIYAALSAMITALIIIIPFSLNQQSPLWIFKLYLNTIGEYPYASVNAFNFFSLLGANYKADTATLFLFNYHTIGILFIVVISLISWFVYIKGNNRNLVPAIAVLQISGVFTFSAGMHERYLFPAVALAILGFINLKDRRFIIIAIGFSFTSYINISTVLFNINSWTFNVLLRITGLLNIILVIYLVKVLFDIAVKKNLELRKKVIAPSFTIDN